MESTYQWTDERVALMIELRNDGWAAPLIAERLGTTRNAILGKAWRLQLPPPKKLPPSTPGPRRVQASKQRPKIFKIKSVPAKPRETREVMRIVPANIWGAMKIVRATEIDPVQLRCVEVVSRDISLIDLGRGECRYPTSDDAPFLFCGHPAQEGSSYCTPHFHLCREESRPKVDRRYSRAAA